MQALALVWHQELWLTTPPRTRGGVPKYGFWYQTVVNFHFTNVCKAGIAETFISHGISSRIIPIID